MLSRHEAAEELTQAVTGSSTATYSYDAAGHLTTAGTTSYAYNGAGELSRSVAAGTYTYTYDAAGDLSSVSQNGALQQTIAWDTNGPLPLAATEANSSGSTTADYAYTSDGALSSMTTPTGTFYPATDWLGSVTGLFNSSGTQVSATTYTPYGTPATTNLVPGAPSSSIGYAGSYAVPGSNGLDDMRARNYDPATSGFTSPDPLGLLTGQPYLYADNAPTYLTDPNGLDTCSDWTTWAFCETGNHWRGVVQAAGYIVGGTMLVACAIATEGICAAAAFEIGSTELSAGAIATDMAIGSSEGAIDYAVAGECNKSLPGLARNMLIYGGTEGVLSAGAEFAPLLRPSDGEHAVPVHWWNLWQILHQFTS